MQRNTFPVLVVASLLVLAPISGAMAGLAVAQTNADAYADKLSGPTDQLTGTLGNVPDYAVTSGVDGNPEFWVEVSESDDLSAVETWAEGTDDRSVLETNNDTNRALVRAPRFDVLGGIHIDGFSVEFHDGLVENAYVERVAIHQRLQRAEPVTLQNQSQVEHSPAWALAAGPSAEWPQDGVAYKEDTNESTQKEAKQATDATGVSPNGSGVTVAVVDSGCNVDNASNSTLYQDRLVAAKDFVDNETGAENASSSNLHGPWVMSNIGADPNTSTTDEAGEGVAPGADLVCARALGEDGSGSTENIADAVRWSEQQGADIISLSLGSPRYSPVLASAIEDALAGNTTLVVVAAGNSRQQPGYLRYLNAPSSAPVEGVISVGATNVSTPANASSAYFSSVAPRNGATDDSRGVTNGQVVDIAAPGMRVKVPLYDGSGYRTNKTLSGTSMATPHVSGAAAVMLDANTGLVNDTDAAREQLLETAEPMNNTGETEVGHGMVNVENAVSDTRPETEQADARTDAAERRDAANRAYAGSRTVRTLLAVGNRVPGGD